MEDLHVPHHNTTEILLPKITGDDIELTPRDFKMCINVVKKICTVTNKIRFSPLPRDEMEIEVRNFLPEFFRKQMFPDPNYWSQIVLFNYRSSCN